MTVMILAALVAIPGTADAEAHLEELDRVRAAEAAQVELAGHIAGAPLRVLAADLEAERAARAARRAEQARFAAATVPAPPPVPRSMAAILACIRRYESDNVGGYGAVSPTGKFRGAYQFDRPTWDGVAGRHYPHLVGVSPEQASPGDQDAMAIALYRERGLQPWPTPSRRCA